MQAVASDQESKELAGVQLPSERNLKNAPFARTCRFRQRIRQSAFFRQTEPPTASFCQRRLWTGYASHKRRLAWGKNAEKVASYSRLSVGFKYFKDKKFQDPDFVPKHPILLINTQIQCVKTHAKKSKTLRAKDGFDNSFLPKVSLALNTHDQPMTHRVNSCEQLMDGILSAFYGKRRRVYEVNFSRPNGHALSDVHDSSIARQRRKEVSYVSGFCLSDIVCL